MLPGRYLFVLMVMVWGMNSVQANAATIKAAISYLVINRPAAQERDQDLYSKKPFGGPEAVLAYLARYTHRVAISNRRLIAADAMDITFRIQGPERYKLMTLATDEFIRRFLRHVLPKGFHRIRNYESET